jgi:three-Cys-motif partner protein
VSSEAFFDESTAQSRIKAIIVRDYFWAWARVILPSVKRRGGRIAYIDLFAGPGRYKDGTKSTPLLVLETAIADPDMCEHLVTLFNDADKTNVHALSKEIDAIPGIKSLKYQPKVEAEEVGDKIVQMFEQAKLVPTFFFVDPWGYKGMSLGLINSVLKNWGCDCIFFFNYNRINMGLGNEIVQQHIDVLFGKERAAALRTKMDGLKPEEREAAIVEALTDALRDLGASFVLPFSFRNEKGTRTSHHLVFATKHPLPYRIMKEIMAKYGSEEHQGVASFEYSATAKNTPLLLEFNDRVFARDLYNQDFRGKQWMHADLSGMSLFGANLEGANLFGARLHRTDFQKASLRGAELAFSYAAGANFRGADLRGCSLYRAEIGLRRSRHVSADFTDALVNEATDIPERKVFSERRLS